MFQVMDKNSLQLKMLWVQVVLIAQDGLKALYLTAETLKQELV